MYVEGLFFFNCDNKQWNRCSYTIGAEDGHFKMNTFAGAQHVLRLCCNCRTITVILYLDFLRTTEPSYPTTWYSERKTIFLDCYHSYIIWGKNSSTHVSPVTFWAKPRSNLFLIYNIPCSPKIYTGIPRYPLVTLPMVSLYPQFPYLQEGPGAHSLRIQGDTWVLQIFTKETVN